MRRLAPLFITLLLLTPVSATSVWTPVATKLEQSLVFVEIVNGTTTMGSCTGFVIDSTRKHVLTAAHCDGEKVLADGTPTYKMFKDERKDLMVLRASALDRPALSLAAKGPDLGDEAASMGYGYAFEKPIFRITHISQVRLEIEGLSGPFEVTDTTFVGGQSGGPVVNAKGEVVMIVQRGDGGGLGLGVGADVIRDRVGRYFTQ